MTSGNSSSGHCRQAFRLMTFVAIGAAPLISPAWAQSRGDTQALNTVTVTSTAPTYGDTPPPAFAGGQIAAGGRVGLLGEKDAMDIPFSVTSYTSELIENQQSQTLGDTLQNDASVSVGQGYGIYGEAFKIRGFNLTGDDVAYGGLYGVLPRQLINSDIAERIEVFKGASAFTSGIPIGGNGGIGGTVNIEPKHAGNEPMLKLSSGYRSDSYGEVGVDASRRFGDQKQWGARVSAVRGRGDTAIDDESQRDTSVVVGLDYRGERGRVLFDVGHQKSTLEGARSSIYTGAATEVPSVPDASSNYTPAFGGSALETNFGMVRGEYDLNNEWTAFAALGGNRTIENIASANPRLTDDNGNASVNDFETGNHIDNFASQAGVRGYVVTGPVSHDVTLGYSSAYRKFDTDWSFLAAGTTNIYDPQDLSRPEGDPFVGGSVTRTRSQGVTLSDTLGFLNDRVLLTLGARYQELEVDERPNAGGNNRYADRRVTPAVGVVFKANPNISLYANYVEALQDGGTVTDTTASNYGEYLGIAHAKQYEVGTKFDYGNIGGGISLFQIKLPTAAVVDGVGNLDNEQRNRGIELSLYGEPLDGLRLFSSATWIDAELTKTQDGTEGNDATGVPEYRFVLGSEWDIPHVDRLTATGRVIHTGSQYADTANNLELDPWTRLDLGVRYTMPIGGADWVWRAGIDNVTDEDYWAGASTAFAGYLIQGEPRTFKLSATVEF
ncbi:TonB-dependent receptor [Salinicola acroporae]|uniref:TonB-dependent siderophore receptor n=1 Tax=Salinicola acroporae TaxID=1541440 RepID=A0ABT6I840_9GAMM|nr:TonB-dependent siderophore receptor [Salinicola acroporae]MDH4573771.1 TonB-dependent siderophore receptor [Salinicola acroporae]